MNTFTKAVFVGDYQINITVDVELVVGEDGDQAIAMIKSSVGCNNPISPAPDLVTNPVLPLKVESGFFPLDTLAVDTFEGGVIAAIDSHVNWHKSNIDFTIDNYNSSLAAVESAVAV